MIIRKVLAVSLLVFRRGIVQLISRYIRYKYIFSGAKIGRNLKVLGNCKIRGWYCNVDIADHVDIHNNCCMLVGRDSILKIGRRTSISYNTVINAGVGNIIIGENTMIAGNCYIVSNDHDINTTLSVRDSGHVIGDVHIGNNVWIGANVVITKGVSIGDGSVIGAGSVVTKDIPAMSIAFGVPCRIITKRILKNYDNK